MLQECLFLGKNTCLFCCQGFFNKIDIAYNVLVLNIKLLKADGYPSLALRLGTRKQPIGFQAR